MNKQILILFLLRITNELIACQTKQSDSQATLESAPAINKVNTSQDDSSKMRVNFLPRIGI